MASNANEATNLDEYKLRMDSNLVLLLDDLSTESVMDQLLQDGILDHDDIDTVKAEKIRRDKVRKMLDMIYHRGPHAYKCLRLALLENYDWIVDKLDSTEVSKLKAQRTTVVDFGK